MVFGDLGFLAISQQKVILTPKLFLWSEQSPIDRWIGVYFMLIKHTISLLLLYLLIARKVPGSNVIQVVGIVRAVTFLGLFDLVVQLALVVLEQGEGFLVLYF